MNLNRKTAIIVGVLFIIATGFLFIGGAIYNPILNSPDYLEITYPNRITVTIGILLEFIIVLAMPLIGVFLFSILKKHNEALALGYVGFRFFEAILFVVIESKKLSLINVSRDYLNRGGIDVSYIQNMGNTIQSMNYWTFSIYVLVFTVGALMLYSVLYKSKLVPRFISVWGIIAAVIMLLGSVLIMVEIFAGVSDVVLQLILVVPIAVNEMVLAVWLIAKGFNPSVITTGIIKTETNQV